MEERATLMKIVIRAFTDKKLQQPAPRFDTFELPINPETYSQNYKVEYDTRRPQGQQGTDARYKSTAPEELKLEFVFDGTGALEDYRGNANEPVAEQVTRFLNTVYFMEGEIHRPKFLKVLWGKLVFPCLLSNLDINYTLFNPSGTPLRAKLSATFINYIEHEARVARENKKSPDLTRTREVKEGDRLDLMTYRAYGDSRYVMQVAKANGLTSFRNVAAGKTILFPPFDRKAQ
jgi:hypothetical protein